MRSQKVFVFLPESLPYIVLGWNDRRSCQLQSLIGLLNHACKVVRPGRYQALSPEISINTLELSLPCRPRLVGRIPSPLPHWNGISFLPRTRTTSRWPPTHQDRGGVGHGTERRGSKSSGTKHRTPWPLPRKNWFPLCSGAPVGEEVGMAPSLSVSVTTKQLCLVSFRERAKTQA